MTGRPAEGEHAPYYGRYVAAVPGDDLRAALAEAPLAALLRTLDPALGGHAYAEGTWTLAALAQHVVDTERIFAVRALRIARGDRTPLPGFDQDRYAEAAPERPLPDLAAELVAVRASTLALFGSLTPEALARVGTASGAALSARAAGWIIAGHERHHLGIVRERYLGG